jgi:hypothetical protein
MKKILLLIVSGLIITCMAGSAMALSLDILNGPSFSSTSLKDQTINLYPTDPQVPPDPIFPTTEKNYLEVTTDSTITENTYSFPVFIERLDPNPPHNVLSDDLYPINLVATPDKFTMAIAPPNPQGIESASLLPAFISESPVSISTDSDAQPGELYRITVNNENLGVNASFDVSVAERRTQLIP